jgi:predicted RND superfamily exporter protein
VKLLTGRRPRVGRRGLSALAVLLLVALVAGGLAQLRFDTGVATFLGSGDPARQAYALDEAKFGSDPITVVLRHTDGKPFLTTALVPTLVRLEGELSQQAGVRVVYGAGTTLNQIAASAQNILSDITFKRLHVATQAEQEARSAGKSDAQVAAAKTAAVQQFDLRYGVLLTQALPAGLPTLSNQQFISAVAFDGTEPRPTIHFVAPDNHTVVVVIRPVAGLDQRHTDRLVRSIRHLVSQANLGRTQVTISGSPVVLAALVDQSRREVPLLSVLSFAVVAALLWLGSRSLPGRRRWLAVVVPLAAAGLAVLADLAVLGWLHRPASLVMVAVLPALIGIGSDVPIYLDRFGLTRRVVVTGLASTAGFAVAGLSPIPFISELGWLLAVGVVVAGIVAQLLRTALAVDRLPRPQPAAAPRAARSRVGLARLTLAALLVVAALGWALLPTIRVHAEISGLAAGLPAEADARQAQDILGVNGELDILLVGRATTPQALAWSSEVTKAVMASHTDELQPVLSPGALLAFLGDSPTQQQVDSALALLPDYLSGAVISADGTTASLSFGVAPGDLATQRALVQSISRSLPAPPDGTHAEVTGVPAAGARELTLLDGSRYTSNLLGACAPSVVLLLLLGWRRRGDAARALLAALIATGLSLLGLAVAGASLTPLTLALGSLTAAVGCEFTVMLRHSGTVSRMGVLLAGSTSIAGYLVLLGSRLSVMVNFAVVLALAVAWAGLAAVVVAWALPDRRTGAAAPGGDANAGALPAGDVPTGALPARGAQVAVAQAPA